LISKRRKSSTSDDIVDFDDIFKDMGFRGFRDIFEQIFGDRGGDRGERKYSNNNKVDTTRYELEYIQNRLDKLGKKIDGIKGTPPLAAASSSDELLKVRIATLPHNKEASKLLHKADDDNTKNEPIQALNQHVDSKIEQNDDPSPPLTSTSSPTTTPPIPTTPTNNNPPQA
jgi:hypothetical protein